MTLGNLVKGAIITGLLGAGSIEAPDRDKSAHEQAYALNASQELTIDSEGLDRLDAIAQQGAIALENVIEEVSVNEDGTGTYRLNAPVGYISSQSLDTETVDHVPTRDSMEETTTFYRGSGQELYDTPAMGLGATPLDAIVDLVSNASEGTYVKSASELSESYGTAGSETIEKVVFSEDMDAVPFAGAIDPGVFTVEEVRSDGMLLGYLASASDARVYGN